MYDTLAANSEKAAERSSTPSNSPLIIANFDAASGPLINMCFAEASFFIFEKNRTASSKKFIEIVLRDIDCCLMLDTANALLVDTMNPCEIEMIAAMSATCKKIDDNIPECTAVNYLNLAEPARSRI